MGEANPRWIDAPEFQWSPDRPFRVEPEFTAHAFTPANDDADDRASASSKSARAPRYLISRLVIGLAQGLGLLALFAGHASFTSSLGMVLLFAPLLLLAGLGRVPGKLLLPWTLIAALALAALGYYQQWRAPADSGALAIILAGLFLFVGQAMVTAWARSCAPLARYADYCDSAWTLTVQVCLCLIAAAATLVLTGAGLALLRQSYPTAHPGFLVTPAICLSVAIMSWLASPRLSRLLTKGLLAALTMALPVVVVISAAAGVASLLLHWQPPLLIAIALGLMLLVCINASYRDGEARPRWREALEFIAALLLGAPVFLGGAALQSRVLELGWSGPRILAAATLGLLAAYAFLYAASALIALGGGGWMKRIERANWVMAIVVLGLAGALASPIADPARLAVAAQMQRLAQVPADSFDFLWLRDAGGRFGHRALEQVIAHGTPDQARGAFLALVTRPQITRPAPTEIGANIDVRTPGARLPAALLARDWSAVKAPGVPPCLTTAALSCDAYFVDLDGDGRDEIVLVYGNSASWWAGVMKQDAQNGWYPAGTLAAPPCAGSMDALRAGRFAAVEPLAGWKDLLVGGTRLAVALTGGKSAACPAP